MIRKGRIDFYKSIILYINITIDVKKKLVVKSCLNLLNFKVSVVCRRDISGVGDTGHESGKG